MITNILTGLKEDRAKFVRELAYIRENAEEDLIADRVEKAERALGRKSDDFESFVEAVSIVALVKLRCLIGFKTVLTCSANFGFEENCNLPLNISRFIPQSSLYFS